MQTLALNNSNLAISQAYRPQLERFFYNGNIYVVENAGDYANLPAAILTLLNGRTSTALLRTPGYYTLANKYKDADVFLHPETDFTTFNYEAAGTSGAGASALVGKADKIYSDASVIHSKIYEADAKIFNGWRGELYYPRNQSQKLQEKRTYFVGFGIKLLSWDFFTGGGGDRCICFQIHQTEDGNDLSGIPPFAVWIRGTNVSVIHSYDYNKITSVTPTEDILYQKTITTDTWTYFSFKIRFDWYGNGSIQVYRDNVFMAEYRGPLGFNDTLGPYCKIGMYRSGTWPVGISDRQADYKGLIVVPEEVGIPFTDIYTDLQGI